MSAIHNIKEAIKKLVLGYNSFVPSFSQAGEDMILRNILRKVKNGVYVDIGAYHPINGSNTYYFYRFQGWRGITIDPNPTVVSLFGKIRPKDTHLAMGVSGRLGKLTYYMLEEIPVMNSFSLDFIKSNGLENKVTAKVDIQTQPLSYILKNNLGEKGTIHFLNIDAEGLDVEILESNDWDLYRPWVIAIETDNFVGKTKGEQFLEEKGYVSIAKTPVNLKVNSTSIFMEKSILQDFENY